MSSIIKEEYDLFVSLGNDCAGTVCLRNVELQQEALPFDWLSSDSFEIRIALLMNNFKDFCNKEDFLILNKIPPNNNKYQSYQNNRTKLIFHHDFSNKCSFDDVFDSVKEKYQRRITRLYNKIHASKKVVFLWFCQHNKTINQEIINAQILLSRKFPHQEISFLILENNANLENIEKESITPYAVKYSYHMFDEPQNHTLFYRLTGNLMSQLGIFNRYALRTQN